jgi:hypothetical protein
LAGDRMFKQVEVNRTCHALGDTVVSVLECKVR